MNITFNDKIKLICEWLESKKAENVCFIDLLGKTHFTDGIIICNGTADIHNRAIADYIIEKAREYKFQLLSKEGMDNAQWILLDLGDVIIHIFSESSRDFYKMERLWVKENIKQDTEQDEN